MSSIATPPQQSQSTDHPERYYIHLSVAREEQDDLWQLIGVIEHLGGEKTKFGFRFPTGSRRNFAVEELRRSWGSRYLETSDSRDDSQPRLLVAVSDRPQRSRLGRLFRRHGFREEIVPSVFQARNVHKVQGSDSMIIDTQLWNGPEGLAASWETGLDSDDTSVTVLSDSGSSREQFLHSVCNY